MMLIILAVIMLASFQGCVRKPVSDQVDNRVEEARPEETETEETKPDDTEVTLPEYKFTCPLDGIGIDEMPIRPVAVTIDNYRGARPQSGLDKADIVYEVPVEGGITRYLAMFFHGQADVIGPVRSARPYLIDISREWDAVYIHAGQSPQAQTYFKNTKVAHINEMFHSSGFWRDKSRKAPHNLYSSTDNLWREIEKLGLDKVSIPEGFEFRDEGEELSGAEAAELSLPYSYGKVGYSYDEQTETYKRFLNGNPYNDLASGVQLSAANVLVQQVAVRAFDSEGRLEVDLIGEGKAWLFSEGRVIEGTWRKDAVTERTRFYDETGVLMRLKTGQTWIQLVPSRVQISY
ncbi:DUF3048 domain-containing protein [Peptoclostridium acidaminophilum]|nr:DUF3048 domain-containing protein [Peptoclostridium acidaminophilum]